MLIPLSGWCYRYAASRTSQCLRRLQPQACRGQPSYPCMNTMFQVSYSMRLCPLVCTLSTEMDSYQNFLLQSTIFLHSASQHNTKYFLDDLFCRVCLFYHSAMLLLRSGGNPLAAEGSFHCIVRVSATLPDSFVCTTAEAASHYSW